MTERLLMGRKESNQTNNNNRGTDQYVRMHRLVCAFVVREPQRRSLSILHIRFFFFLNLQLSYILSKGRSREKTCLRGFQQSDIQTSLLSYRD